MGMGRSDPVLRGIDDVDNDRQANRIIDRITEAIGRTAGLQGGTRSARARLRLAGLHLRDVPAAHHRPVDRRWPRRRHVRAFAARRHRPGAGYPPLVELTSVRCRVGGWGHRWRQWPARRTDPLARFSALTREWFTGTFAAPTAAQTEAWEAIADGDNTLVIAPTGSGKTLAAFLWAIDQLAAGEPRARQGRHPGALHLAAQGAGRRRRTQPAAPR